ncbi:hypothetical protein BDZ45DRAFT_747759 [Acephala macrosclerotiorum]|nr:hypothetical protein BDZ45DRAFT_747759 [Acephala macrosclerotiorum]
MARKHSPFKFGKTGRRAFAGEEVVSTDDPGFHGREAARRCDEYRRLGGIRPTFRRMESESELPVKQATQETFVPGPTVEVFVDAFSFEILAWARTTVHKPHDRSSRSFTFHNEEYEDYLLEISPKLMSGRKAKIIRPGFCSTVYGGKHPATALFGAGSQAERLNAEKPFRSIGKTPGHHTPYLATDTLLLVPYAFVEAEKWIRDANATLNAYG